MEEDFVVVGRFSGGEIHFRFQGRSISEQGRLVSAPDSWYEADPALQVKIMRRIRFKFLQKMRALGRISEAEALSFRRC